MVLISSPLLSSAHHQTKQSTTQILNSIIANQLDCACSISLWSQLGKHRGSEVRSGLCQCKATACLILQLQLTLNVIILILFTFKLNEANISVFFVCFCFVTCIIMILLISDAEIYILKVDFHGVWIYCYEYIFGGQMSLIGFTVVVSCGFLDCNVMLTLVWALLYSKL